MDIRLTKINRVLGLKVDEISKYWQYFARKELSEKQKFILVCDYRSGSTLLASLLNQHPDIYCDGEIFIPFIESKFYKLLWPYGYLQGKRSAVTKPIYGFDCKLSQIMAMGIQPPNTASLFFDKLYNDSWHFIYLKRLNIVRQGLSNHIAIARQQWHDQPQAPLNRRKVTVDLKRLYKAIENRHQLNIESQILMENIPHLPLIYEHDLLSSNCHQKTAQKVCDHLGVKAFYCETNMRRVSADKLSDDIDNFDEVVRFLKSSPYAHYVNFEC